MLVSILVNTISEKSLEIKKTVFHNGGVRGGKPLPCSATRVFFPKCTKIAIMPILASEFLLHENRNVQ